MMPTTEGDRVVVQGVQPAKRFRFSIRSLMILIVMVAGILACAIRYPWLFLPAIPLVIVPASGLAWSIGRIDKDPSPSIVVFVAFFGSLLWCLLEVPFLVLWVYCLYTGDFTFD